MSISQMRPQGRNAWQILKSWLGKLCFWLPDESAPHRALKIIGLSFARALGIIAILVLILDGNLFWLFGRSPSWSQLAHPELSEGSEIWSSDGVLLGRYYLYNRNPIDSTQVTPDLEHALLASEDIRFYQHRGVDPKAPFAIAWAAIHHDPRGGSTITQQLAKNLFQTRGASSRGLLGHVPVVRVFVFKMKEWVCAFKLEMLHSKHQILTLYLNTVNFGNNAWGIQSAARSYFSRDEQNLGTEQMALLIGMLKAPTSYDPVRHPEKALARRNTVLQQMAKYGFLTKAQADSLIALPLGLQTNFITDDGGMAPFFREAIMPELKAWCEKNDYDLMRDGLKIHVTIDSRLQKLAEESVTEWMTTLQRRFDSHWQGLNPWSDAHNDGKRALDSLVRQTPQWGAAMKANGGDETAAMKTMMEKQPRRIWKSGGWVDSSLTVPDSLRWMRLRLQAGLVVLSPADSRVLAWVGGVNWRFAQFDHVLQGRRQPGSTFKPFVYATALTQGWSPCDKLMDHMVTINYTENGENKSWTPHNADWNSYNDSVTLRLALGQSINTVTAQLTQRVGPDNVAKFARECGITSPLKAVPSIGLGTNQVSMLELAGAYCPLVNGGTATKPWYITSIEDRKGKVLETFKPTSHRVLDAENAWLISYMMKGGIEEPGGTSQSLHNYNVFMGGELGGKTGTSSEHRDGWFVGVSPNIVGVAWSGDDDPAIHWRTGALGEGAKTALPLFATFLQKVLRDPSLGIRPAKFPKAPAGLTRQWNCPTPWDALYTVTEDSTGLDSLATDSTGTASPEAAGKEETNVPAKTEEPQDEGE